ncbi:MAG TPA: DUF1549 and DUF1553 domain-containing protein [Gemmataceae bacterium]
MKLFRPLALFAVTFGLAVLVGDVSVGAQNQIKQQKKLKKNKNKNKRKQADPPPVVAEPEPLPPAKPLPPLPPPGPKDARLVAKMIDDAIAKKLADLGKSAAPLATDEEFLRRAYLDLNGVIPTADKARAFLDSTDANKRAKLIDELLDDSRFGRHLADFWQARLIPRESNNRFVLREPFTKWLEASFNKNVPWNQFVSNLVAAAGSVEENPAVTFYLANRSVDKLTDHVTQSFLGVQLQCAQCHNHPFTEWKQTEYWGMAEFFSKVKADRAKNAKKGGDNNKIGVIEGPTRTRAKDFFPESAKTVPAKFLGGEQPRLLPSQPYRPALARWITDERNPYFAKSIVNRTWGQLFGAGFVNPIDDMHDGNRPSHPELFEKLARNFAGNGFDLKNLYRAICNSQAYQRSSKPASGGKTEDRLFAHMTVKVFSPEQLYDSLATAIAADKVAPQPRAKGANNPKRGPIGLRDQFVQFFLAGADSANAVEYEAGIPQALRLMNSRITNNPGLVRQFVSAGDKPATVFEKIYLAVLSRRPTPAESKRLGEYFAKSSTAVDAYRDVLWVLLNSSEFTMIR